MPVVILTGRIAVLSGNQCIYTARVRPGDNALLMGVDVSWRDDPGQDDVAEANRVLPPILAKATSHLTGAETKMADIVSEVHNDTPAALARCDEFVRTGKLTPRTGSSKKPN